MEALLRERKSLDVRVIRVTDTVKRLRSSLDVEDVEIQTELDHLREIWDSYLNVHRGLVECCADDEQLDEVLDHLSEFEDKCIQLKNCLLKLLKRLVLSSYSNQHEPSGSSAGQEGVNALKQLAEQQTEILRLMSANMLGVHAPVNSASSQLAAQNVQAHTDLKLPRMNLPIFSGDVLEWQSFYDLFDSAVHKNQALQDSQKLYFLKTNLAGEAASLVSHLKIEDANYAPALAKLKERYNKPLEIATQHIKRFLSQPPLVSPSAAGLRSLHDVSDESVRALTAMHQEGRDIWLLYILQEKLDPDTKQQWCQKKADLEEGDITLEKLLKFVDAQSSALKSVQPIRQKTPAFTKPFLKTQPRGASTLVVTNQQGNQENCFYCSKSPHQLYQCGKFSHSTPDERISFVRRQNLCTNCLKQHPGEPCRSGNCRTCNEQHHTRIHDALHPPGNHASNSVESSHSSESINMNPVPQSLISPLNLATDLVDTNVLLLTVTINVLDQYGRPHVCRAVLDCASHTSYVAKDLCDHLGLPTADVDFDFGGIAGTSGHASKGALITFSSRCSEYRNVAPCVVLQRVTAELPLKPVDITDWPIPGSIHLADPQFHHPGKISLLLGNKLFFQLLEPGIIKLSADNTLPVLQNTKLGWVVAGGYKDIDQTHEIHMPSCLLVSSDDKLSEQLRHFWELEEYTNALPHFSNEETRCEEHFAKNTTRDHTGRFIVRLPFQENPALLGESRDIAAKRLFHLERKLNKNPQLKEQYHAFIKEYADFGHMTLATTSAPNGSLFLPHHCVVKEASTTTKCRVVFDASAKTSSGKSLNDMLMAGPVLQDSLINILLRYRFPAIVLAGDIQKMYRMVQLHEDDRNYQMILWRWSENEPVQEYRLNTITYGTKSASYLATKCVQQLLSAHQHKFPEAVEKATKGIYVDDVLTGADSEVEAKELQQQLSKIFTSGGFHLRKWASNSTAVLDGIPVADREMKIPIELNEPNTIKALGIHWQPCSDEFQFSYQPNEILQPTKRAILSQIASLFDPLGLLAPIIIKAKLIMQKLWELKVDWDANPPGELTHEWLFLVQKLSILNSFQVPRRVIGLHRPSQLYLHGYSDASERAMGACIYIRCADEDGSMSSRLLCAKSKLAPIGNGRTTLPRLELCAAVLLTRLMKNVMSAIDHPFFEIRAWTDSQVVLAWLIAGASRWKTFVANRVAEITTHLPAINWQHIDTHQNPADLISRGVFPEQLMDNPLWWNGPNWNEQSGHSGGSITTKLNTSPHQKKQIDREERATAISLITVYENRFLDNMMARYYPDLQMLLRVTARMLRFAYPESRGSSRLLPREIDRALDIFLKHVQEQHFQDDLQRLQQKRDVKRGSTLHQLKPFLDERGLLRVGGRLEQSGLNYDTIHPILLPRSSIITSLVLIHDHVSHHHCGPQTLLAVSRRRYWIIRGTSASRKIYRQCVACARAKPKPLSQQMGQLPSDRVKPQPPFSICGVDYAGPINIVSRRARGVVSSKGYIALFVCLSTKAVHMEAVSDLTTTAFLAAFTRFSSRYGLPAKMWSDNATNFRSASKQLQELYRLVNSSQHNNQVTDFMADKGVEWNFIPARSPHHGGLWEAAVKVAKQLLGKITGKSILTFEELSTLLAQVAATMNSRPITAISADPSDPQPLTPAHFLIGRPLTLVPEINLLERSISTMSRWQYVQRLAQEFRTRWQLEYVRSLQRMTKWKQASNNIAVGDLVLLVDDNTKAKQWPLGRVLDIFPGPDGLVRVASVKTAAGETRRDVRRLRVIPLDADEFMPGRCGMEIPNRNLVGG